MVFYCVKKKRLFFLGILFFFLMSISGIYSLADEMKDTESGLSTGAVDIEIQEYNQNDEPFLEDGKMVMPGDVISLVPRVHNLGIECYIRAKITYTIDQEVFNVLDYIEGNYSSWTKEGDYYYYPSVLGVGDSIDLFEKVMIPNVLADQYQGKTVVVHMVVDAIQSKNFDENWEGIEIKESVDRTYDIHYGGESSIIYENDVNHHITIDGAFFNTLGNLLPGDSATEEVVIQNRSNNENEYFLAIDYDSLSDEEVQLLSQIQLKITDSHGNVLVNSHLANKERHSLGIFRRGEGDTFTISLFLPNDLDNDYSKLFTKVMWRFSFDMIREGRVPPNPKTWDFQFDLSITVFILSTIGFIIVLFLWKKNTENIEKK